MTLEKPDWALTTEVLTNAYPEVDHELSEEDREKLRAMGYIE